MYNTNEIASRIKALAKGKGVTVKTLLENSNVNWNFMSPLRAGAMPKADSLGRIADYLDVSVDYLLGRTDVPEVNR